MPTYIHVYVRTYVQVQYHHLLYVAWVDQRHRLKCTKYSTEIYYLCVEQVAITDIPGLDPGNFFFVRLRFPHSEELIPVVAAFSVSILKTLTEKAASISFSSSLCTNLDITKELSGARPKTSVIILPHTDSRSTEWGYGIAYLLSDKVRR